MELKYIETHLKKLIESDLIESYEKKYDSLFWLSWLFDVKYKDGSRHLIFGKGINNVQDIDRNINQWIDVPHSPAQKEE